MRDCEAAYHGLCECRTAAADTAHHHPHTDVHPRPKGQAPDTETVPHDGRQRAKTLYDARTEKRGQRTVHNK